MSFKITLQPPSDRPTKAWSLIDRAIKSKKYLSSVLLPDHKSLSFRISKNGFKIPKYQNTYRLESYVPFQCEVVDKILRETMQNYLSDLKYHPQTCMQICQRISNEVRNKICKKAYDRYKVVVIMSIAQKLGQTVQIGFGKLWDIHRDTYSTHVIETQDFAAMGLVVGIYYE